MKLPQVWIPLPDPVRAPMFMNMSYAYFNPTPPLLWAWPWWAAPLYDYGGLHPCPLPLWAAASWQTVWAGPRIMTIAFAIMAVGTFAIALVPQDERARLCGPVRPGVCGYVLQLRHRVLLMDDGGIPMEVSGTAVGVICTIGLSARGGLPATAGIILDTFTEAGYKYYFLAVGYHYAHRYCGYYDLEPQHEKARSTEQVNKRAGIHSGYQLYFDLLRFHAASEGNGAGEAYGKQQRPGTGRG